MDRQRYGLIMLTSDGYHPSSHVIQPSLSLPMLLTTPLCGTRREHIGARTGGSVWTARLYHIGTRTRDSV
eukprot:7646217-Heterocapsa_arctica.AAC.1